MKNGLGEKIRKLRQYLRLGLWGTDWEELPWWKRIGLKGGQLAIMVVREFLADGCFLRASALTYTTLLAIVPLFAFTFSVLSGLGVQNTLEALILERLTVGGEEMVQQIITYINNTNFGQLGTVGLISLIVTVWALMANIEGSLNGLWASKETRPVFRRFADYMSVLLLGPVFLFAAISMTSTLMNQSFMQRLIDLALVGEAIIFLFRVLPYVAMWAAFTFLYIFMPNVKVQLRAALVGGIFGGTLWQLAQWTYVLSQVGVARYNAIYGTLAAIPILMVWIYISWLIVLLGGEVTYVWQNQSTIRREIREEKINFASQEMVALTLLMKVTEIFYRREKPWTLESLSEELHLPPRIARIITMELTEMGYLSEVQNGEAGYRFQPACPPERTTVHNVLQDFRRSGADLSREKVAEWKAVRELEKRLAGAEKDVLDGLTLRDLALQGREENG